MTAIRPPNAASVWIINDHLYIDLPASNSHLSHSLCVKADAQGFLKLASLLRNRTERSRIGEAGDPTQHHLNKPQPAKYDEALVRRPKAKDTFAPALQSAARDVMRRMGLI